MPRDRLLCRPYKTNRTSLRPARAGEGRGERTREAGHAGASDRHDERDPFRRGFPAPAHRRRRLRRACRPRRSLHFVIVALIAVAGHRAVRDPDRPAHTRLDDLRDPRRERRARPALRRPHAGQPVLHTTGVILLPAALLLAGARRADRDRPAHPRSGCGAARPGTSRASTSFNYTLATMGACAARGVQSLTA